MPVKKIDQFIDRKRSRPLIATFSKGTKDGDETDYFRPIPINGYSHIVPKLFAAFGDMKTLTPAYVLGVEVPSAFSYWYENYDDTTGQFLYRCDGENRVKWLDTNSGEYKNGLVPCIRKSGNECNCSLKGRLHILLPTIDMGTGLLGRYLITTGSHNDIKHILSVLEDAKVTFAPYDIGLDQIPFVIRRMPKMIDVPDEKGGFSQAEHYMIEMQVDPDYVRENLKPRKPKNHNDAAYLPYLQQQFNVHLEDYTIDDFAAYYGETVADFVQKFPYIHRVKRMVFEWVIASKIAVRATRVRVTRKGEKSYRYNLDIGFGNVTVYTTRQFKELEYDVKPFWRINGANHRFTDIVRIRIAHNKSQTNIAVTEVLID